MGDDRKYRHRGYMDSGSEPSGRRSGPPRPRRDDGAPRGRGIDQEKAVVFRCKHCGERRTLCPECGKGELTAPRQFNLMFKTFMGPVEEDAAVTYLRPETAQGIFVNFDNVLQATRRKLPFGIAQIGKAFRNEITPGNFIFRDREFEQMEMEFFVEPGTDEEWHEYWIEQRVDWYRRLGMKEENLRVREHEADELAHYAKRTADIEYRFPIGWSELMGIANRTDFDLRQHAKWSGKSLTYFDEERKEHVVPYVVEPAAGVDRALLAFMADAYREEEVRGEKRVVLRFHPELAPLKIAVLPLLKKRDDIVGAAQTIRADLAQHWRVVYDDTAAIGRLYRRQDEVGTPYCVTVDVQTVGDSERGEAGDRRVTWIAADLIAVDQAFTRRLGERLTASGERELIGYILNSSEKNYACAFLDLASDRCQIYPTRPLLCRLFNCDAYVQEELGLKPSSTAKG